RARLARVAPLIGVAYAATAVLVSPYLYYALQPGGVPVVSFSADKYATDLAGLAIPTQVTFLGGLSFPAIVNAFTTNLAERSAYLGVPLIAMIVLAVRAGWRERGTRIMVVTLLAILLCSLGAHLHVAGARTLPLPWAIVDGLPVIGLMLPARFMVYCDLAAALLATTWLSRTHHRRSAWVLVLLSIAFLAPAVRRGYWNSVPPVPRLFRSSAYRRTFRARDIVLVLPMGFAGQSMLWQADAHLGFRMAGG